MMEKELAEFRKAYSKRVVLSCAVWIVSIVIWVAEGILLWQGNDLSSVLGMLFCMLNLGLFTSGLYANGDVLKDTAKLKKMYLQECDERNVAIRIKAGQPVVQWIAIGMLLASCIISLILEFVKFERDAKMLLLGIFSCMWMLPLVLLIISWALKKYWEKRM